MSRPAKSTTARGLGWQHQKTRQRLLRNHRDGAPCWWCGQPMYRQPEQNFDSATLEADHTIARSQGGRTADRLLHRQCNRERGNGDRDDQRPALGGQAVSASASDDLRSMPWPW